MAQDMSGVPWRGMGVPGSTGVLMGGRWQAVVKNARDEEPQAEAEAPEAEEEVPDDARPE